MFLTFVQYVSGVSAIITLLILLVRPVREKILGFGAVKDAQRCTLRSDMLRTYYKHREEGVLRQYELENFILEYKAYKALRGNSFVDKIYQEVLKWEVTS